MKIPARLEPLVQDGMVDEVLRELKSGKEASVYVVRCGEHIRCAKVYKDAKQRSFRHAASYQEGRRVKNSRQARAMEKGSRYGRKMQEETWQNAEVEALFRLANAGVRVPQPYLCHEGVLLMDLVTDETGSAAPRLADTPFTEAEALDFHQRLLREVVRMLCAGMIHGDLSEYNILVDAHGPVIIDLPQAVDAAGNNNASAMLGRDIRNLADFFGKFAPALLETDYAREIWSHYQAGTLTPEVELKGKVERPVVTADLNAILAAIAEARREAEARKLYREEMDA